MFFSRTRTYYSNLPKEELKNQLIGNHVRIHNLDFEVFERDNKLSIVPHAEEVEAIKTLPITSVVFKEKGNKTTVVVRSKMRQLDSGGPFLIVLFCLFMFIASIILLQMSNEQAVSYTLLGISLILFTLFWIRLQVGYFDYVRKVQAYVKSKTDLAVSDAIPFARA